MTGEGTLEFRLLGPIEARLENRTLPLGGVRQRGLLALLLLRANEVVSRDRLIDELWRDHAPETAANALAALVSRLRRVLPADVLLTRSGGYEASVELDAIDLFRFQRLAEEGGRALAAGDAAEAADRLRSGLALWRGPPLADFTYELFAEPVIRRLAEIRLAAVENHRRLHRCHERRTTWQHTRNVRRSPHCPATAGSTDRRNRRARSR